MQRRRWRQRGRQQSDRFMLAKNNLTRDHAFYAHFFAVVALLQRETA